MSYMLFKGKRPISNKKFEKYEQCRSWARKLIRSKNDFFDRTFDLTDLMWRNPSISRYGYSIRRV